MPAANGVGLAIAGQCSPLVVVRMLDCVSPADFVSCQTQSIRTLENPELVDIFGRLRPIRRAIDIPRQFDRQTQERRGKTVRTSWNIGRRTIEAADNPQGRPADDEHGRHQAFDRRPIFASGRRENAGLCVSG
jgi:hypothetical protein